MKRLLARLNTLLICFSGFFFLTGNAHSVINEYQDMQQVSELAKAYLLSQPQIREHKDISISVNRVDRRLKLQRCEQLDFELAAGANLAGKTSIRVICLQPKPWRFYLTANISRFDQVYVTNGPLQRGHIIRESDVSSVRQDLSTLPFGYLTRAEQVIGQQVKRRLQAGKVITPSQLTKPLAIKRGETVSLENNQGGFAISMKGTAMDNGAVGERIRVKNNSSKRIIEGIITQPGVVNVGN